MKRFIAFSGGVESSAMCVLFGGTAQPVFTDTGWEHARMYARIRAFDARLAVRRCRVWFQVSRDNRSTAQVRRWKGKA